MRRKVQSVPKRKHTPSVMPRLAARSGLPNRKRSNAQTGAPLEVILPYRVRSPGRMQGSAS